MENDNILYLDGNSARATNVRVLVFNECINLYNAIDDHFIAGYPVKGASSTSTGENIYIYLDASGTIYLHMHATNALAATLVKEVTEANDGWMKKLLRQKAIVLVAIMCALIVAFYVLLITLVPIIGSAMISRQSEIEMGNKLRAMMMQQEALLGAEQDTALTKKLQRFADNIKLSRDYPIRVTAVKSSIVNAYALPGGQIVVYTGMLNKIEDAESLAALLSHEASHVNERHTLRSMLRSGANGLLISIVFNDATGISAALVGNAETLRGLQYSRKLETEADERGMQLMLSNDIDPAGMKRLMMILDKEGDVPENISFLSSHPLTKKRIAAADAFIKSHAVKAEINSSISGAFNDLKK
jgi:predicted Zn-dependent protease